jgi:Zn-dependent protease with chaperone function
MAEEPAVSALAVVLLAGTALLFVVQEVVPLLRELRPAPKAARHPDPALSEALARVFERFHAAGVRLPPGPPLHVVLADTEEPIAALDGMVRPVLVVSRGLVDKLDAFGLEAVMAHEVAHFLQGGNRRLAALWVLRALQAPNPAALVFFRLLVEAREAAADALAAQVTGRPAVLAQALLALHTSPKAHGAEGTLGRARARVLRKAEVAATRLRVRTLLDGPGHADAHPVVTGLTSALVLALLWGIA